MDDLKMIVKSIDMFIIDVVKDNYGKDMYILEDLDKNESMYTREEIINIYNTKNNIF